MDSKAKSVIGIPNQRHADEGGTTIEEMGEGSVNSLIVFSCEAGWLKNQSSYLELLTLRPLRPSSSIIVLAVASTLSRGPPKQVPLRLFTGLFSLGQLPSW